MPDSFARFASSCRASAEDSADVDTAKAMLSGPLEYEVRGSQKLPVFSTPDVKNTPIAWLAPGERVHGFPNGKSSIHNLTTWVKLNGTHGDGWIMDDNVLRPRFGKITVLHRYAEGVSITWPGISQRNAQYTAECLPIMGFMGRASFFHRQSLTHGRHAVLSGMPAGSMVAVRIVVQIVDESQSHQHVQIAGPWMKVQLAEAIHEDQDSNPDSSKDAFGQTRGGCAESKCFAYARWVPAQGGNHRSWVSRPSETLLSCARCGQSFSKHSKGIEHDLELEAFSLKSFEVVSDSPWVYASRHKDSKKIGTLSSGATLRGRQEGDWLRLDAWSRASVSLEDTDDDMLQPAWTRIHGDDLEALLEPIDVSEQSPRDVLEEIELDVKKLEEAEDFTRGVDRMADESSDDDKEGDLYGAHVNTCPSILERNNEPAASRTTEIISDMEEPEPENVALDNTSESDEGGFDGNWQDGVGLITIIKGKQLVLPGGDQLPLTITGQLQCSFMDEQGMHHGELDQTGLWLTWDDGEVWCKAQEFHARKETEQCAKRVELCQKGSQNAEAVLMRPVVYEVMCDAAPVLSEPRDNAEQVGTLAGIATVVGYPGIGWIRLAQGAGLEPQMQGCWVRIPKQVAPRCLNIMLQEESADSVAIGWQGIAENEASYCVQWKNASTADESKGKFRTSARGNMTQADAPEVVIPGLAPCLVLRMRVVASVRARDFQRKDVKLFGQWTNLATADSM